MIASSHGGDQVERSQTRDTQRRPAGGQTGGLRLPFALVALSWAATLAWVAWGL